jgi:phosphatidylglycerophosphate synthase
MLSSRRVGVGAKTMSYPAATMRDMKTIARMSAITLMLAVTGFGSRGWALLAVVALSATALAALAFASARLGYFRVQVRDARHESAEVIWLEQHNAAHSRENFVSRDVVAADRTALRGR